MRLVLAVILSYIPRPMEVALHLLTERLSFVSDEADAPTPPSPLRNMLVTSLKLQNFERFSIEVKSLSEVLDARIPRHGYDPSNDIAVLVIEPLPANISAAIPLGSARSVRETQRVYALGHPSTEATWAITEGTVSRKQGGKLYFSGTAVNGGNSGGPLLDEQGVLVAMNLHLGASLGSALAWDVIRPLIEGWVPELWAAGTGTSPPLAPPPVLAPTRRGKDKKDMLLVPEGWFVMGSTEAEAKAAYALGKKYRADTEASLYEDEKPQHRVRAEAFYMEKYEVTLGEYKVFIAATGRQGLPESVSQYAPKDTHPASMVRWEDADAYCRWAEKQLPTEGSGRRRRGGTMDDSIPGAMK